MLSVSSGKTLAVSTYRLAPAWVGEVSGDKLVLIEAVSRTVEVVQVTGTVDVPELPVYEVEIPAVERVLTVPGDKG